jgi:hypothetical protein
MIVARRKRKAAPKQADLYTPSLQMIQKAGDGAAIRAGLDAAAGSVSREQMQKLREAANARRNALRSPR